MARTAYPRAPLRRIVKAHANRAVGRDVDVLIYLNYLLFMQDVLGEAAIRGKVKGGRGVSAGSVRRVAEGCLRRCKG